MAMLFQNGTVGSTGPEMWLPAAAYDSELGVTMPMKYFDPLGLAKAPSDAADFRRRREAEIKNGRVAMFAAMGYIAPEYFRWPGYLSPSEGIKFTDVPNGVAALSKVPAEGWAQIGCFIAFLELFPLRQDANRLPGDFATCGKLGVPWFFVAGRNGSDADPVANKRGLDSEINNGRLAMVAITGMISQNGFFGSTENMWLPSGAFETELGVQAPVGFFDPLKLSADGDVANFKRRRAVELKHGRVCMLATLGNSHKKETRTHRDHNFLKLFCSTLFATWVFFAKLNERVRVHDSVSEATLCPSTSSSPATSRRPWA